ncbi:Fic family protein [Ectothiorhodospiraceae bacterium BW-2]|nr:Fic family protein [Ectothiorhodospiraceae bacterium BW-2]
MHIQDFDLSVIYPETDDLFELYEQLTDLKKCLDSFRPLTTNQVKNITEVFDTEYTYESNAIEGNTLTLMETEMVIHRGMTISGKPLKDHQEAINHRDAIQLIRELARHETEFNQNVLLQIHAIILSGIDRENAGMYRRERVRIAGSRHICPNYLKIPQLMEEYFHYYEANRINTHPVELASNLHEKLVTIHPFIDGNGRTARLVMNLILLKNGYPITVIHSDRDQRLAYYNALETAQISETGDNSHFQRLIAKYVKKWLFQYLNLLSDNGNTETENRGYYFFQKIEPYL